MNLMSLKISCRFSGPRIPSNWHPSQPLLQALLAWLSGSASSKAKPCEGRFHPIILQTIKQINLGLVVFIVLVVQEPDTLIRWRDMKSVRLSWNPKPWPPRIPSFSFFFRRHYFYQLYLIYLMPQSSRKSFIQRSGGLRGLSIFWVRFPIWRDLQTAKISNHLWDLLDISQNISYVSPTV